MLKTDYRYSHYHGFCEFGFSCRPQLMLPIRYFDLLRYRFLQFTKLRYNRIRVIARHNNKGAAWMDGGYL
jgi:hypothetical protein